MLIRHIILSILLFPFIFLEANPEQTIAIIKEYSKWQKENQVHLYKTDVLRDDTKRIEAKLNSYLKEYQSVFSEKVSLQDKQAGLDIYIDYGVILFRNRSFDTSRSIFNEALKLNGSLATIEQLALIYNNLGDIEMHVGNYQKALAYLNEAQRKYDEIGSENECNRPYYYMFLNSVSKLYLTQGDMDEAQKYISKAIYCFENTKNIKGKDDSDRPYLMITQARVAKFGRKLDKAQEFYSEAYSEGNNGFKAEPLKAIAKLESIALLTDKNDVLNQVVRVKNKMDTWKFAELQKKEKGNNPAAKSKSECDGVNGELLLDSRYADYLLSLGVIYSRRLDADKSNHETLKEILAESKCIYEKIYANKHPKLAEVSIELVNYYIREANPENYKKINDELKNAEKTINDFGLTYRSIPRLKLLIAKRRDHLLRKGELNTKDEQMVINADDSVKLLQLELQLAYLEDRLTENGNNPALFNKEDMRVRESFQRTLKNLKETDVEYALYIASAKIFESNKDLPDAEREKNIRVYIAAQPNQKLEGLSATLLVQKELSLLKNPSKEIIDFVKKSSKLNKNVMLISTLQDNKNEFDILKKNKTTDIQPWISLNKKVESSQQNASEIFRNEKNCMNDFYRCLQYYDVLTGVKEEVLKGSILEKGLSKNKKIEIGIFTDDLIEAVSLFFKYREGELFLSKQQSEFANSIFQRLFRILYITQEKTQLYMYVSRLKTNSIFQNYSLGSDERNLSDVLLYDETTDDLKLDKDKLIKAKREEKGQKSLQDLAEIVPIATEDAYKQYRETYRNIYNKTNTILKDNIDMSSIMRRMDDKQIIIDFFTAKDYEDQEKLYAFVISKNLDVIEISPTEKLKEPIRNLFLNVLHPSRAFKTIKNEKGTEILCPDKFLDGIQNELCNQLNVVKIPNKNLDYPLKTDNLDFIAKRFAKFLKISSEVYDLIFSKIPVHSEVKEYIIIPDETTYYIPFPALRIQNKEKVHKYLIENVTINLSPSSSIWFRLNGKQKLLDKKELIGFVNNEYPKPTQQIENPPLPPEKSLEEFLYDLTHFKKTSNFFEITKKETYDLKNYTFLENEKSTPPSLLSLLKENSEIKINEYNTLLFLAHSFRSSTDQIPKLYLSPADPSLPITKPEEFKAILGKEHDTPILHRLGLLSWSEISNLELKNRCVILAACETFRSGEEKFGEFNSLPNAFLTAGTSNVLSTLWKVESSKTISFVHEILAKIKNNKDKSYSQILQEIQIEKIKKGEDPFIWASFVLYGSGQ